MCEGRGLVFGCPQNTRRDWTGLASNVIPSQAGYYPLSGLICTFLSQSQECWRKALSIGPENLHACVLVQTVRPVQYSTMGNGWVCG